MQGSCSVLIYGSGRLARLVGVECVRLGHVVTLAGRHRGRVQACANAVGADGFLVATPADAVSAASQFVPIVVINTAGPYAETAPPLIDAATGAGIHYLDAANEPRALDAAFAAHDKALSAGVSILPGLGFGVAVAEAVAVEALHQCPTATELRLVFTAGGSSSSSPGGRASAMTLLAAGPMMIRDGRRTRAWRGVRRHGSLRREYLVPLLSGDPVALQHSLAIPNITAFFRLPLASLPILLVAPLASWVLRVPWFRRQLSRARKPSAVAPVTVRTVQGVATSPDGRCVQVSRSARGGVEVAARLLLAGLRVIISGAAQPGVRTPHQTFTTRELQRLLD